MPIATPFKAVHAQLGAKFAEYAGWEMPADFGNIEKELTAAKEHCAAYDLSCFGRITLAGKGKQLLDEVIIEKTAEVFEETWVWAKIGENNTAVDIVRIGKYNDKYIILTSPEKRKEVFDMLSRLNAESKFALNDVTENTAMLGLYGPSAFEIFKKIPMLDVSGMEIGGVQSFDLFMMSLTIIRGSWAGGDGIEIICPIGASNLAASAIGKYRDKEDIAAGGMESLKQAMDEYSVFSD